MTQTPGTKTPRHIEHDHLIPSVFIAFLLALKVPYDIYWGNVTEYTISAFSLLVPLATIFVVVFLLAYLPIFLVPRRLRPGASILASLVAIGIWFTGSFLHTKGLVLDGRQLHFNTDSFGAWLEVCIYPAVFITAIVFRRKLRLPLRNICAGLLLLTVITSGVYYASAAYEYSLEQKKSVEPRDNSWQTFDDSLLGFSSQKNVIHLVLDELQATVLTGVLAEGTSLVEPLDGFINFADTLGNHPNTVMGIPAMMTGNAYRNDVPKAEYIENSLVKNIYTKALDSRGFRSDFHTLPLFCNAHLYHCSSIASATRWITAINLFDFSLFRAFPLMLKPAIYNNNAWLLTNVFMVNSKAGLQQPVQAVDLWQQFTQEIYVAGKQHKYKLFHSLVTHSPAVLDRDCKPIKPKAKTLSNQVDQAVCAFSLLSSFFDRLKALEIYDNSLIVISSDHGSDIITNAQSAALKLKGIDPGHYPRALAVLLIKPFESRGTLRTSHSPVQLSDIPKTVLSMLDMGIDGVSGENLLMHLELETAQQQKPRVREYIHYEIDFMHLASKADFFPKTWRYSISGASSDVASWNLIQPE